jgi:3-methyl-2-oxobutanoate hydroxymethyltransferase
MQEQRRKVTISTLRQMKAKGETAVFLTAYDYPFALMADQAGVDMILVGDSLGMTVLGHETTLPVTMDDMIRHSQAVTRAVTYAFVVGDMPFMSYQPSDEVAIANGGRFLAEAGCDCVKLEGGRRMAGRVRAMVDAGLLVMGHLGLTPQNAHQVGGYRVQGKTLEGFRDLMDDALALEEAGACSILLEGIPDPVGSLVAERLSIPIYGIGAGSGMDGQLLIMHDVLGLFDRFTPKFVKRYAEIGEVVREAFSAYASDVRSGRFPGPDQFYPIDPDELDQIRRSAGGDRNV